MKHIMDKVYKFYHKYRNLVKLIDRQTTMKTTLKSVFGSLLISFLIVLLPVILLINLFIFTKLTIILSILLVFMLVLWVYLYYHFYYVLIQNYHEKIKDINTKIPKLVEFSFVGFILLTLGVIVLSVVF
jgi:apolipoprotein N-acyltransferase